MDAQMYFTGGVARFGESFAKRSGKVTAALQDFDLPFVRFGSFSSDRDTPDALGMSALL
jgi:hypothetical protein